MSLHYEPEFKEFMNRWWRLNIRTELKKFPRIKKHNSNYNVLHIEGGEIKLGKKINIPFISHRIEEIEFDDVDIIKKYLESIGMKTDYVPLETHTIKVGDDTLMLPQPKDLRRNLRKIYRWCYKFENEFLELYNLLGAIFVNYIVKVDDWKIYIAKPTGEDDIPRVWIHFRRNNLIEVGETYELNKTKITPKQFYTIDIESIQTEIERFLSDSLVNKRGKNLSYKLDRKNQQSNSSYLWSLIQGMYGINGNSDDEGD